MDCGVMKVMDCGLMDVIKYGGIWGKVMEGISLGGLPCLAFLGDLTKGQCPF